MKPWDRVAIAIAIVTAYVLLWSWQTGRDADRAYQEFRAANPIDASPTEQDSNPVFFDGPTVTISTVSTASTVMCYSTESEAPGEGAKCEQ